MGLDLEDLAGGEGRGGGVYEAGDGSVVGVLGGVVGGSEWAEGEPVGFVGGGSDGDGAEFAGLWDAEETGGVWGEVRV